MANTHHGAVESGEIRETVTHSPYRGTMERRIDPSIVDVTPPRRHDGRVVRVSSDYARLRKLDHLLVGEDDARVAVVVVCETVGVPIPRLKFHARRSPFTGACEAPRGRVSDGLTVVGDVTAPTGSSRSEHGAIRLGRSVTLMTLAHELGHHIVNHLDHPRTPSHGKVWVGRFDEAAAVIDGMVGTDPT
jgi:hypothetical protein